MSDKLEQLADTVHEISGQRFNLAATHPHSTIDELIQIAERLIGLLRDERTAARAREARVRAVADELERQSETLNDSLPGAKVIEADIHTFNWAKSVGRVYALNDAVKAIRAALDAPERGDDGKQ